MTAGGDPLRRYFVSSPRRSANLATRDGVRGAVDAALNDLYLPATLDEDGDWLLEADVGQVQLYLDTDTGELVVRQVIRELGRKPDEDAEAMQVYLNMNVMHERARFVLMSLSGSLVVFILGRRSSGDIDRAKVEELLDDVMGLSRRLDERSGRAQPEPNGLPPAGWYADPEGGAHTRWWDGQRWTERTSL